jgi:hypothetical protein
MKTECCSHSSNPGSKHRFKITALVDSLMKDEFFVAVQVSDTTMFNRNSVAGNPKNQVN